MSNDLWTRRVVLQRAMQLGVMGVATPLAINLAAIGEAAAFDNTDYKALVCLFMYGGNDYANTVVPYDNTNYNLYSAIRGGGFGLGAAYLFGGPFGITFGVLSTAGQVIAYRLGIRPTLNYKPASRPRLTWLLLLAAANRTVGYTATGYVSSLVAQQREHAVAVGLKAGLVIGIVTALVGPLTPFIEWRADHVPERRMGVFGIGLMLIGFTFQSVQYWVALLDVTIR